MGCAVVWADAADRGDSVTAWSLAGSSNSGWLGIAGPDTAVGLVKWLEGLGADHLLIFSRRDAAPVARYLANIASGAIPLLRVAHREVNATGLATLVAAEIVMAGNVASVDTLLAVERLLAEVRSGLWLPDLWQLDEPNIPFLRRLGSLIPGGRGYFVVFDDPLLVTPANSLPRREDSRSRALILSSLTGRDRERLMEALGGRERLAPPVEDLRGSFGQPGYEFVLLPDRRTAEPVVAIGRCPVCHFPVAEPVCPFCRALVEPTLKATR